MVGLEPRRYHVQQIRIYSSGFYSTITIKHTISRELWTIRFSSVDPFCYVGTFLTVTNSEIIWLWKSEGGEIWSQDKEGKVKKTHAHDIPFCFIIKSNNSSKVIILLQFSHTHKEEEKGEGRGKKEGKDFIFLVTYEWLERDAGPKIQFQSRTLPENYRWHFLL